MQSGEDYVLKVPSKGFFLAAHMLDGVTFGRHEGACLSPVPVAVVAVFESRSCRSYIHL